MLFVTAHGSEAGVMSSMLSNMVMSHKLVAISNSTCNHSQSMGNPTKKFTIWVNIMILINRVLSYKLLVIDI